MSRRNAILIAAGAVFLAALLLLPSFTARAFAAVFTLLAAIVLIAKALSSKSKNKNLSVNRAGEESTGEESAAEIFALGKLFEATMSGMREGLLVVDKDMRVVASNPAAHRLFNLSQGKLDSQRLTELTRNPAIYTSFLEVLKVKEQSLVKVETHHWGRQVFDLLVVPLGSSDGQ